MKMTVSPLIIPVEQQVREFDAKLLLACVAAERGIPSYIGFQNRIRNRITTFPPGIFIAKGFGATKATMLDIMRKLGHRIFAWDEEGLVHLPNPVYHEMRMGKGSLQHLSGIFSWGPEFRKLIEESPLYRGTPIHDTGNPRVDLLRPELRSYYDPKVEELHQRYGRFILINSAFGHANMFAGNKMVARKRAAQRSPATAQFWAKSVKYRTELFHLFKDMVSELATRFADTTIVLRPHPSENFETWDRVAANHENLHIVYEGNIVPWLLAAEIAIHNGCMTAVEGVLLGKTVFAYQPLTSDEFDRHLPNRVSIQCFTFDALRDAVASHFDGARTQSGPEIRPAILDEYIEYDKDKLAADLIMDVLEQVARDPSAPSVNFLAGLGGWTKAHLRAFGKWVRSFNDQDMYFAAHQRRQFPQIGAREVEERIERFAASLGRFQNLTVRTFIDDIFLVERTR